MSRKIKLLLCALALLVLGGLIAWLLEGCGCPQIARSNTTNYPVASNLGSIVKSPAGVNVILNGNALDLEKLDKQYYEVMDCLKVVHPLPKYISFGPSCVYVYVVPDFRTSCEDDGKWQVFGHLTQDACNLKGFTSKEGCECGWRGELQDGKYILITPDQRFFKPILIELFTGYNQDILWNDKNLVKCMSNL